MPRISDRDEIRSLLETDRVWWSYALGDLSPGFLEMCERFRARDRPALALLLRGFSRPDLFTMGAPAAVQGLLDEIGDVPEMSLPIRPAILPLIRARGPIRDEMPMWRMAMDPGAFRPAGPEGCRQLTMADCDALQLL